MTERYILNEEMLLNAEVAKTKLTNKKLKIDKIVEKNGEKIIYMKENTDNLICG